MGGKVTKGDSQNIMIEIFKSFWLSNREWQKRVIKEWSFIWNDWAVSPLWTHIGNRKHRISPILFSFRGKSVGPNNSVLWSKVTWWVSGKTRNRRLASWFSPLFSLLKLLGNISSSPVCTSQRAFWTQTSGCTGLGADLSESWEN